MSLARQKARLFTRERTIHEPSHSFFVSEKLNYINKNIIRNCKFYKRHKHIDKSKKIDKRKFFNVNKFEITNVIINLNLEKLFGFSLNNKTIWVIFFCLIILLIFLFTITFLTFLILPPTLLKKILLAIAEKFLTLIFNI